MCDYDLAGLPEQCRCPECAQEIGSGLHSVSVWWLEPPSMLQFVAMLMLAMIFNTALIVSFVAAPQACSLLVAGFFAFGATFGTVVAYKKLHASVLGETDARLHFSPRIVGLWHGKRMEWHRWEAVRTLTFRRPWLSRYWVVHVKGRRRWYALGKRRSLVRAVARWNRREASLIRNTLRRYWRREG